MDYFGPMQVSVGRRREKRWGVLFTCLSTRAVHLELASTLNTDSAIMAIRRLIARRGCPKKIMSDNGTNLHGANNEIKQGIREMEPNSIVQEMTGRGIEWSFISPQSPHQGGSWERLVRSVKTALKEVLKEQAPKEEVLLTLLVEAEHTVNSRPLVHVSIDPEDEEALTPNHFLLGTSSSVCLFGSFDEKDLATRKNWKISQYFADCFWRRWIREYLPTLTRRTKWFSRDPRQVRVDDIVVIADGSLPRNCWPKGRIVAVYPGVDGQIRNVDVKTQHGTYRRSTVKICILDVNRPDDTEEDENV